MWWCQSYLDSRGRTRLHRQAPTRDRAPALLPELSDQRHRAAVASCPRITYTSHMHIPPSEEPFAAHEGVACSRRPLLLVLPIAWLVAMLVLVGSAAGESPLKWSPPTKVDGNLELSGISCPSAGLCVAIDRPADDVVTTHRIRQAAPRPGQLPLLAQTTRPGSRARCQANRSSAWPSTACPRPGSRRNPLGGAGAWTRHALLETPACGLDSAPTGVSCASTAMCVRRSIRPAT